ncbi:zinc metallopeptidase [Petroclostridium sp. X23]|uniref:zinc metallopeptidase n=1 Tax=Petroclostridium sp. X23 TaxID=3045146 RepID=UPI0024AD13DE|nr:zinc metallopeptidase [Petroclostridium sp. X23]WHH59897.1 zinc metallopeptidase [Petroclostridium sp. X23]
MGYLYGIDMYYIILVMPAVLFALYAQSKVQGTFNKYLNVRNVRGYTGAYIAREILDSQGLHDVRVEMTNGHLTDHYDPRSKVVRLSQSVYSSTSVGAVGVAAHETGHAIQHQVSYAPLAFRNSLVPVASLGSSAAIPLAILGLIVGWEPLVYFGIIMFTAVVAFQVITLPVEFNASSRALEILETKGLLSREELVPTKKVLNAAALTYVAAAAVGIANLLRLLLIAGVGRRRD